MKRIILFLSLTIAINISKGQNYIPFPMDSTIWRVDFYANVGPGCYCYLQYQYFTHGDTTINAKPYTKIMKTGAYYCGCGPVNQNGYNGAIRQDTIGKKIYIIQPDSTVEKILYDFNQNVGDTIKSVLTESLYASKDAIITSIDSILIGSVYHREFQIQGSGLNPIQFIEGIGSTLGLLEPLITFEFWGTLVCVANFGQTIYPDTVISCPFVTDVIKNDNINSVISIYPNPADDNIIIEIPASMNETIFIYNIMGQLLLQQPMQQAKEEINISSLAAGVYFIKVSSSDGIAVRKFIKE